MRMLTSGTERMAKKNTKFEFHDETFFHQLLCVTPLHTYHIPLWTYEGLS